MSSSVKEVITLQLGHYANFVGAHWWNLQESSFVYTENEAKEINHDVFYREGRNLAGDVTYTPRLVAMDLKGSLNTLRQEGTLYDFQIPEENIPWQSDVTLHNLASGSKNDFLKDLEEEEVTMDTMESDKEQCVAKPEVIEPSSSESDPVFRTKLYNLDDKVNVWSDFLRVHYHPRTIQIVEQFRHDDETEFDVFGHGADIYKDYATQQEIEDKLHFFLEECDHMQGIQLLVEPYSGFGGLASSMLEDLADDYGNKAIFTMPVTPPVFQSNLIRQTCHRLVNTVLSYESMFTHSSAVLPLSLAAAQGKEPQQFPHLNYNPSLPYHSSAILAAGIDNATLPYRQNSGPVPMASMLDSLAAQGRKLLCLQSSFPYPIYSNTSLVDSLMALDGKLPWQPLTPMCTVRTPPLAQSVVLRGIGMERLKTKKLRRDLPAPLEQCSSIEEVLQLYLSEVSGTAYNNICSLTTPLKLQSPFPHIFQPTVSTDGHIGTTPRQNSQAVTSAPHLTSMQASTDVKHHLKHMLDSVKKFNIKKFHKFLEAGLEEDDYSETLKRLEEIYELYVD